MVPIIINDQVCPKALSTANASAFIGQSVLATFLASQVLRPRSPGNSYELRLRDHGPHNFHIRFRMRSSGTAFELVQGAAGRDTRLTVGSQFPKTMLKEDHYGTVFSAISHTVYFNDEHITRSFYKFMLGKDILIPALHLLDENHSPERPEKLPSETVMKRMSDLILEQMSVQPRMSSIHLYMTNNRSDARQPESVTLEFGYNYAEGEDIQPLTKYLENLWEIAEHLIATQQDV